MIIYWFKKLHLHKWEVVKLGEESCDPFYIYDCDYPIGTIKKCTHVERFFNYNIMVMGQTSLMEVQYIKFIQHGQI